MHPEEELAEHVGGVGGRTGVKDVAQDKQSSFLCEQGRLLGLVIRVIFAQAESSHWLGSPISFHRHILKVGPIELRRAVVPVFKVWVIRCQETLQVGVDGSRDT